MEYDVAVIGAGPGGYIAAIRASQLGLKTIMFEGSSALGGTCLNVGCIPSKTLLHSSELFMRFADEAKKRGSVIEPHAYDFPAMMTRKNEVVSGLASSVAHLLQKNKIDLVKEWAKVQGPNQILAGNKEYRAKSIILASGSEPIALPFLPFDEKRVLTSTGALALEKVPKRMLIVGGGVIGVELGSVYARLGSDVTIIEMLPQICTGIDRTLSSALLSLLKKQNLKFLLNMQVLSAKDHGARGLELIVEDESAKEQSLHGDVVLVAIGRRPRSQDLGVASLNVDTTPRGAIVVDREFRTSIPTIYAIGDLIDGPMLAHRASYEGVAVAEVIAGMKPKLDYITIPNVVYTSPELATCGLSEEEAKELKRPIKLGKCAFIGNPRARTAEELDGLVKIVADRATDRILGLHILAPHASEMIEVGVLALYKRCTLADIADLPFAHPTFSEAIKEAALQALGRSYHL